MGFWDEDDFELFLLASGEFDRDDDDDDDYDDD